MLCRDDKDLVSKMQMEWMSMELQQEIMADRRAAKCMRLIPLRGLGRVRCLQPYPGVQRGCLHVLNL